MIPYSKLMKKRGCESEFLLYLKMYAFQREDIKFLAKEEIIIFIILDYGLLSRD